MNSVIELTVFPSGEVKLETKGFEGATCKEASRFLKEALGPAHNERLTAEFYSENHLDERIREAE